MTTGMGCSSSVVLEEEIPHTTTPVATRGPQQFVGAQINHPETVLDAYRRMDEEICALESTTPGPRLATAEAWVELLNGAKARDGKHFTDDQEGVTGRLSNESVPNGVMPTNDRTSLIDDSRKEMVKVREVVLRLDIVFNQLKAAQQEEFVARLSRAAMDQEAEQFREEMIDHARQRVLTLQASFERLKRLYLEQDYVLAMVYNGRYGSPVEQRLDGELDAAREVRDRLGGAVEQWRIAGGLLRAAAKGLHQTVDYWELLRPSKDANETVRLALDARTSCHGALVALEAAQAALPHVDIPYITIRQQSAVRHALIYLLTDMVNPARYQHTRDVFGVFGANVSKAVHWLHECYDETLRQDYDTADQGATLLAKTLREERLRYIGSKVPNKIYVKPAIGK
ncbi:AGAP008388-PA-like protein [Anopheles sinensis]|uniref:AGAP008388-PA-like protein n=1 Tax=Anopheles sinensis TaxID=74873 RepID=A0A084WH67_ANOSI|nr:AGAP008388-PA-like protein [Anopheles sinensis]